MHGKRIRDEHTIVYFFKISKGACCGLLLFERNQTRTLLYVVTATSLPPSELKLIIFKKSLESGSSGVKQSCRAKLALCALSVKEPAVASTLYILILPYS
jgi:hypothetical protein